MLDIVIRSRFKKDLKKAKKQGKDLTKLFTVVGLLSNGSELEDYYRVHKLTGNWANTFRVASFTRLVAYLSSHRYRIDTCSKWFTFRVVVRSVTEENQAKT